MTDQLEQWVATEIAEIEKLFGPPPLLSSESMGAYKAIMAGIIEYVKPKNFFDRMQAKQATDDLWKVERYKRHQILAVARRERYNGQLKDSRAEAEANRRGRAELANQPFVLPTNDKMGQDDIVTDAQTMAYEELRDFQCHKEIRDAQALEQTIVYVEKLEWLLGVADGRLHSSFKEIEHYRQSLVFNTGKNQIVEAQYKEIEDSSEEAPLIPSASETDEQ